MNFSHYSNHLWWWIVFLWRTGFGAINARNETGFPSNPAHYSIDLMHQLRSIICMTSTWFLIFRETCCPSPFLNRKSSHPFFGSVRFTRTCSCDLAQQKHCWMQGGGTPSSSTSRTFLMEEKEVWLESKDLFVRRKLPEIWWFRFQRRNIVLTTSQWYRSDTNAQNNTWCSHTCCSQVVESPRNWFEECMPPSPRYTWNNMCYSIYGSSSNIEFPLPATISFLDLFVPLHFEGPGVLPLFYGDHQWLRHPFPWDRNLSGGGQ